MALEDFTTYTETDPNNKFSKTANEITVTGLIRTDDGAIFKDYGANHFEDFIHLTENKIDVETGGDYSQMQFWALSNNSAHISVQDFVDAVLGKYCAVADKFALNKTRWRISDREAGNNDYSDLAFTTERMYLKIERSGTAFTLYIYSDSNRTVLEDSLPIVCTTTKYRYVYGTMGQEAASNGRSISGKINNLDLQEAPPPSGGAMQPMKHWGP